jgi:phospholipid transport system transporter-binding protein
MAADRGAAALAIDGDTLRVSGRLDADSVLALHRDGCSWLAGSAPASCRVDLGGVAFSSSAGVALLLDWLRVATGAGKQLQFANLPKQMDAIIRVSGLETLFTPAARQ